MSQELRIRVIHQASEEIWLEVTIPHISTLKDIDIEVKYPDDETVRYVRELD